MLNVCCYIKNSFKIVIKYTDTNMSIQISESIYNTLEIFRRKKYFWTNILGVYLNTVPII